MSSERGKGATINRRGGTTTSVEDIVGRAFESGMPTFRALALQLVAMPEPLSHWVIYARLDDGGRQLMVVANVAPREALAERMGVEAPRLAARLREPVPSECVRVLFATSIGSEVRDMPMRQVTADVVEAAVAGLRSDGEGAPPAVEPGAPAAPPDAPAAVAAALAANGGALSRALAGLALQPDPSTVFVRIDARPRAGRAEAVVEVLPRADYAGELGAPRDAAVVAAAGAPGRALVMVVTEVERSLLDLPAA